MSSSFLPPANAYVHPDGTPVEHRKSARKRTRTQAPSAFDYLDKDEAAHLQIALQNSLVETKSGDLTSHVKDAPEFRPSVAEWADPIKYIEKIRVEAEAFGIAKIIPPAGWEPPYTLKDDFKFPTSVAWLQRQTAIACAVDDCSFSLVCFCFSCLCPPVAFSSCTV